MSICLCTKSREKNSLLETFLTGWDWGRKQRKNKEKGRNAIYGKLVRKTLVLVWMRVPGECPQPLQGPWAPAGWGWGHSLLPPRWPGSCWPLTLAAEGPRCPAPGGICSSVRVSAHLPCPAPRRCWQTCLWGSVGSAAAALLCPPWSHFPLISEHEVHSPDKMHLQCLIRVKELCVGNIPYTFICNSMLAATSPTGLQVTDESWRLLGSREAKYSRITVIFILLRVK